MPSAEVPPFDRQFGDLRVPLLVVMAGLPGSGKSTVAEVIGPRLGATVISVDPIESAILEAGIDSDQPTGLAAYLVAEKLSGLVLASGGSVVVDAVNAVEPARLQWLGLAARHRAELFVLEVVCTDPELHRSRLEKRVRNLPHLVETSWHAVEESLEDYQEWVGPAAAMRRITLDSTQALGLNVDTALAFINHG